MELESRLEPELHGYQQDLEGSPIFVAIVNNIILWLSCWGRLNQGSSLSRRSRLDRRWGSFVTARNLFRAARLQALLNPRVMMGLRMTLTKLDAGWDYTSRPLPPSAFAWMYGFFLNELFTWKRERGTNSTAQRMTLWDSNSLNKRRHWNGKSINSTII